jgi:hypothetical protein
VTERVVNFQKKFRVFPPDLMVTTDLENLRQRQIGLLCLDQGVPCLLPSGWHCAAHSRKSGGHTSYGFFQFSDAATYSGPFLRLAIHMKEVNDGVFPKEVPNFLAIDIWLTVTRAAVCRHDEYFSVRLTVPH